jgi:hypothetical protein
LFLTLEKAREMGLSIKINSDGKREQSWPVFKWIQLIFDKQGTKISYDEYQELDEEEKEKCRTFPDSPVLRESRFQMTISIFNSYGSTQWKAQVRRQ